MRTCQLLLRDATWTVVNFDRTTTTHYNQINRDKLDSFELKYKKRKLLTSEFLVFKLNTNGKTLIHRLKTQAKSKLSGTEFNIQKRIRITALLQRNKNPQKNKSYGNYSFDPELSEIHYIFEDGTIERKNDFGDRTPYLPLELFPEELEHLMKGV